MRLFLIVLIVVGIAFLGIVGLVGNSEEPPADYKPGSLTAFFGNLALLYPGATWTVPSPNPFPVPRHATVPASGRTRVARFALKSGNFARVTFACAGSDCSQSLCLVGPGGPTADCQDNPKDTGSLVLDPAGGTIDVTTLPPRTAVVESR
jgi:hypothetical protein